MTDWQPIETAPRDGNIILAMQKSVPFIAVWRQAGWGLVCAQAAVKGATCNDLYIRVEPTHWMPLPEPPK